MKVPVDVNALRRLLGALQGLPHEIRELQATRGLGDNPIDLLQADYVLHQQAATTDESLVWLNLAEGEFSESWPMPIREEQAFHPKQLLADKDLFAKANDKAWKLIRYTCENDANFQFNRFMRLR